MNIDASQRFIFGLEGSPEPLGSFKLDNIFIPTLGSPSQTNSEMRNEALSGYRWIHETASDETYGSFRLQRFLEASPTGIDIMTFNDDGTFIIPGVNDAKYIIQTANVSLPNAQSLGALTTGILKNTVTAGTGVLSSTVAGVDYYAPNFPTTLVESFTDNVNPLLAYGNLGVGTEVLDSLTLNSPTNTLNLGFGIRALSALTTGAGNTGLGMFVFLNLETGNYNTGIGTALKSLEEGDYNTAVGTLSGNGLINGNKNCFFGATDNPGVATLNECTFLGFAAGASVTDVEDAISIGSGAVVNGSEAIAIGRQSQAVTTSIAIGRHAWSQGAQSISIGNQAQNQNDNSVVIGFESTTGGSNTVAIGHHAEAIGQDSIAIGHESNANDDSIGSEAIAIGKNATARGTNSIALGKDVLVTADNSIALGNGCKVGIGTFIPAYMLDVVGTGGIAINVNANRIIGGADPVDPQDFVTKSFLEGFVGDVSEAKFIIQTADADLPNAQVLGALASGILKSATTTGVLSIATPGTDYYSPLNPATLTCNAVTQNASFSRNAYSSLTSGTGNAIFNVFGGQGLTSGTGNVIFAGNTGQALTTGSSNILMGNSAGGALTTGSSNVLMGVSAGADLTTPNFNVIVGTSAGSALQTGASNVCVGTSAGLWGGGGFASYDHCVFLGHEAQPTVSNLTNAIAIGYLASVSASNSMVLGNDVNVGIGTSGPTQAKLIVSGGVTNVASEFSVIRATGNNNATKIEIERSGGSGKLYELRSDDAGAFSIFDRTAVASRLFINTSGNIGLNMTSSILAKLHITGGVQNIANEDTIIRGTSSSNVAKIELQCTNGSGKNFEIRSDNAGAFSIVDRNAVAQRFFMNTSGQIGLGGVTAPHAALQLPSVVTNRQLVLYEAANNDYQFHGFGSISGGFGYNINDVADSHVFFAGVNSSSRNELARISGVGTFTTFKIQGRTDNVPGVAAGSAAGSSPTLSLTGGEISGTLSVTAGSTPSGTLIVTFTLDVAMASANYGVVITPANQATASLATPSWINVTSTTQFTINNLTPLVATTVYKWNYHILGV